MLVGYYNYTVLLTYISVFISSIGIFCAINGNIHKAIICLMISGICDMFDGKIAATRKRDKNEMRFGVQIDSLCDLVCFGVLPTVICYQVAGAGSYFFYIAASLYILAGVIRLAYFNVIEENRQDSDIKTEKIYIGFPITSMALLLPLVYCINTAMDTAKYSMNYTLLLIITAVAFIVPIKIKKPQHRGMAAILGIGTFVFVFVLLRGYPYA